MVNIGYNALDGQPAQVVKEIAENINAVVRISHNEIRPRINEILTRPISETDEKIAAQQIKSAYEQLTKKETIAGAFETAERIALYQADFVDRLREVFVYGGASYSVLGSIGAMRSAARAAAATAARPQVQPADEKRAQEELRAQALKKDDEEHKGEDRPPPGGFLRKVGRISGVAGLSGLAGLGAVAATKGVAISGVPLLGPLMNVPALQTAATAVKAAATTAYGWTPWLSWLQFPLNFAAWATPGLAVGTATVGGLWTLGKIREGAERREFYKRNPTGRFQKKTFLQNVKGGAGLLFSPLKLFTAIPLGVGSAASWGAGKIGDGFAWVGKNAGTIAKGVGVGTIVGGTLAAASAFTGPGALIVGAGCAGAYTWLNRKGAHGSSGSTSSGN